VPDGEWVCGTSATLAIFRLLKPEDHPWSRARVVLFTFNPLTGWWLAPSERTFRRVLEAVDGDTLDAATCGHAAERRAR